MVYDGLKDMSTLAFICSTIEPSTAGSLVSRRTNPLTIGNPHVHSRESEL